MKGILVLVRAVGNWVGNPLRNSSMVPLEEGRLGYLPISPSPLGSIAPEG